MRDALIFVLVVAVAVLGYLLHLNSVAVSDQRHQITDLSNKLDVRRLCSHLELVAKVGDLVPLIADGNTVQME